MLQQINNVIKVDIVSDVVCPWCYIGKKRFEKATDALGNEYQFEVNWHPYQLNPDMPREGRSQREYFSEKFGSWDRFMGMLQHVKSAAEGEGLQFAIEKHERSPNTLDAHRVVKLGQDLGLQDQILNEFFKAYFEEAIDLTQKENLIAVAVRAGISRSDVTKLLETEEGLSEVIDSENHYKKLGVTGVPFFIVNDKYAFSGAQPTDSMIQIFKQVAEKEGIVAMNGPSCDVEGNC